MRQHRTLRCAIAHRESRDSGFSPNGLPRNDGDYDLVALTDRELAIELELSDDAIPAELLGKIQCAVAAIDQIRHRLAELELADTDRHRDRRQHLAGRAAGELALRNGASDTLGDAVAGFEVRTRQHGNQLLAAIAGRQVVFADTVAYRLGHQAQHLVADAMAIIVVE